MAHIALMFVATLHGYRLRPLQDRVPSYRDGSLYQQRIVLQFIP